MPISPPADLFASQLAQLILFLAEQKQDEVQAPDVHVGTPFSTMEESDWSEAVQLWNRSGRHLVGQLDRRACPACGTEDSRRPIFESYDGYLYEECTQCSCWHVPLKVDAGLFERFFDQCPQAAEVAQRSFKKRLSDENRKADLVRFDDYLGRLDKLFGGRRGLRYLDVGCGVGNSLVAARSRGFEAIGIESSRESVRLCREAGLDVRHVDENLPAAGFDLITFWESLEHMADPSAMFAMCDDLLADNGAIAFTIPNLNSPLLRAQRADSSVVHGGYDTPGHINLFGPSQIQALMERSGFAVLHMDGQYGMHLPELVSYMLGRHRGAVDLLGGRTRIDLLPPQAGNVLQAIGPATALLERFSLTAPILFVVACRKRNAGLLAQGAQSLEQSRRSELLAEAARQAARSPLVQETVELRKALASTLQEVNKRDELLALTQGEVDRRDLLLAGQAGELNALRGTLNGAAPAASETAEVSQAVARMQQEINTRDALLTATQNEVNRRDELLAQQNAKMQEVQNEARRQDVLLAETTAQLQEIRGSFLFKLARTLGSAAGRKSVADRHE